MGALAKLSGRALKSRGHYAVAKPPLAGLASYKARYSAP